MYLIQVDLVEETVCLSDQHDIFSRCKKIACTFGLMTQSEAHTSSKAHDVNLHIGRNTPTIQKRSRNNSF